MRTRVVSDKRRIEQVMLNLISNALKFTFDGFIKVAITIENEVMSIAVIDSGVGIKRESLPHLFQLFGKLQENQHINRTGCGFGLHISQELVTRLGGRITAESKENEGSVFSFSIPLGNEEYAEENFGTMETEKIPMNLSYVKEPKHWSSIA